ncbi:carbon-phosphorus lyase complex subunit PhnI [Aquisalimonas lutea]|uniref:carbon-phosphorus lyase complex subunit PhnI n=1 Tax=Aquisalimonas lutea TaxID=1327750 RepID=UPI0025B2B651|nr:carbon-phosphorus lyase complex subunit PhnI [Aquisalimonas lutea]MDN3516427.1 carbon-phosphorus lyase complex subunit PhnI [Aquisalimonas lutea]
MYATVKGGEQAIDNAHRWLADQRRGDRGVAELDLAQIRQQMGRAVDRVMSEGSLADPELAAVALKQAQGDINEAVFLLRAYRNTLPRLGRTEPLDTGAMRLDRRITPVFKDTPGGQMLGPTFDYSHRLLDFSLAGNDDPPPAAEAEPAADGAVTPITEQLVREGLTEPDLADDTQPVADITREPLRLPAGRDARLQALARGDEGFLLGLAYSTQRGHGGHKVYAGEVRQGEVTVSFVPEELGFPVEIGRMTVSECHVLTPEQADSDRGPGLARGYGLAFGRSERKAMTMALVDRALQARERGERIQAPAQDEEYVLGHLDSVHAAGFLEHLKLPHYVDFQAELATLRALQQRNDRDDDGGDQP